MRVKPTTDRPTMTDRPFDLLTDIVHFARPDRASRSPNAGLGWRAWANTMMVILGATTTRATSLASTTTGVRGDTNDEHTQSG